MCFRAAKMMTSLPFDIIMVILFMLPIKSLVRFQNVCRAWRDLIRDPSFIKRHFQNLASKGDGYILYSPWVVHADDRTFRLLSNQSFEHVQDIEVPIQQHEPMTLGIVGSCNGLLCLFSCTDSHGISIYLCNPSIRKCRTINLPITNTVRSQDKHHDFNISLGFGYVDGTDDYKIVRIGFPCDEDVAENKVMRSEVDVYSMVTDLWKTIGVDYFPWKVYETKPSVVVNESIHWDAVSKRAMILAFHMREEVFRQIDLPDYQVDGDDLIHHIGVFRGKLSLFSFRPEDQHPQNGNCCYLWVMNEYGVGSSWSKMYSITLALVVYKPITFTQKDEIIFENDDFDVNLCHFDSKAVTSLEVDEGFLNFTTYMDSLVMVGG